MVKAYKFLFTLSLVITLFLLVVIILLNKKQIQLNISEAKQYKSFKLSEELRSSSDNLTRYCRTYVITGDSIWEEKFWNTLAVRNGEIPRPDGRQISLKDSMMKIGFLEEEVQLFNQSEKNSNILVETERAAFNAMKGIFKDSLGNFTIQDSPDPDFAKRILFDEEYHQYKKDITEPILQFNNQVENRTLSEIKKIEKEISLLTYVLVFLIISLIILLIFFLILIQSKIRKKRQYEVDLKKAKKKAEENDKFKSIFIANMSHEIRTPLNAIIGFANQLTTFYKNDKEYQRYITIVKNSGEHLLNLINDILEISKIEANKLIVKKSSFLLDEIVNEMYVLFSEYKRNIGKEHLELELKRDTTEDRTIISDKTKLKQILANLIGNAIKFTHTGKVEIQYHFNDESKEIVFCVKDTGVGIPREQRETIFKRFLQSDQTIDENEKGTGLGLEITRAIVHALKGKIWVESEVGKGSSFYFTIPLLEHEIQNNENEEGNEVEKIRGLKKVLIAEDSDVNFLLLRLFLKEQDCEIVRVMNGVEAIEMMENDTEIDLVLMDVRMPKLNGWEAIKNIREFNTSIPIIVQTANSFDSDLEESLKVGATDFISKPIKKEELLTKIEAIFLNKK